MRLCPGVTLSDMPAPLGKTPTKKMPDIHVFGTGDSAATRAATRFFRERRIVVHQSDLRKRPIAAGELQRFVQRLGARALLDVDSRAYLDQGLAHMRLSDGEIVTRLLADVRLLRLPLIRHGNEVTVGSAEATWTTWVRTARGT
jgi:arsenate reductase-like glutaredoxin family protein